MDLQTARDRIIDALPARAAHLGWTERALAAAALDAGAPDGYAGAAFPGGVMEALAERSARLDDAVLETLKEEDVANLRIRDKAILAVRRRVEAESDARMAARRAVAALALPHRVGLAARMVWRSADMMWTWMGDRSTDYNRYTKRGLLSGVYGTTFEIWARSAPDSQTSWTYLDRRIENVIQFEKLKAQVLSRAPFNPSQTGGGSA